MIDARERSSRLNTFCTMRCSPASIKPASTPSTKLALISSSVTVWLRCTSTCNKRNTAVVLAESSCTKGLASVAKASINGAVTRATVSGYSWPMRLGTNSPKTMVMKVMSVTTNAVARPCASDSERPWVCSHSEKSSLNAASPTMPLSTPIEVMPICTVDKNRVG